MGVTVAQMGAQSGVKGKQDQLTNYKVSKAQLFSEIGKGESFFQQNGRAVNERDG